MVTTWTTRTPPITNWNTRDSISTTWSKARLGGAYLTNNAGEYILTNAGEYIILKYYGSDLNITNWTPRTSV